jgi:CheY-like chemotaxis protein
MQATCAPLVLVVGDNASHSWDVCEILRQWGITPVTAADGAQAVAMAAEFAFDVIVMGLDAPVLDGLSAALLIRYFEREQATARASVLVYTSDPLDEQTLQTCGVDGVLLRPCNDVSLHDCLLRWCGSGVYTLH